MLARTMVVSALVFLGGCGDTCTDMGCVDGLTLSFEVFDQGTWTFELDLVSDDDFHRSVTCIGVLPLNTDADTGCDDPSFGLILSGSALPEDDQSIAGLVVWDLTPEELDVRVSLDDVELLSTTLNPSYSTTEPNGEGCEPACISGGVTLDL